MRVARSLVLVALLPLFAACQLLDGPRESASHVGQTRLQGQLTAADGKLLFQPCNEQRSYVVNDSGGTSVLQEAASLADDQGKLCLLYTSPSPRDRQKSRMPSSA